MAERRGFLKALGLGGAAAVAAGTAQAADPAPVRADAVPPGLARKEDKAEREKARYRENSADVQAFYRTNRYGG